MTAVTIYTKTGCPYCAAAKKHYTDEAVEFTEINITEKPDVKKRLLEITGGQRTVPVIVDGDTVKIGFGGG
jgi:glutaredoxin 3